MAVLKGATRPRPSVDRLLSSAATAYGDRVIAVMLTGSGADGAAGAVDVHNAGGSVDHPEPGHRLFPAMPLALPPTVVDYVVDLERIGPLLYQLVEGLSLDAVSPDTAGDPVQAILGQVSKQANIDFRQYKQTTILRRIGRRMALLRQNGLPQYATYVAENPVEVGELVNAFLINVTDFFRDSEAFDYLRRSILPGVIVARRAHGRVLRFWSAGCATGEEPYSLALMVTDMLGSELPDWSVKIFATDLDGEAINFARRGVYPESVLRNVPADYRARFFEPIDNSFRVIKSLRQMVIFGQQDISRGVPFPRIDLVLCRNVLIYFQPELQQAVLDMFAYSLRQTRGVLWLGPAETVRPSKVEFEQVNKRWKLYRCAAGPLAPGSRRAGAPATLAAAGGERQARPPAPRRAPPPLPDLDPAVVRRFNDSLLRYLPSGIVVVDRAYHIVTINGAGRRLLGIRDHGLEQDFLHLMRGLPYSDLRTAIDSVFRDRDSASLNDLPAETVSGEERYLSLTFVRMPSEAGSPELTLISVTDTTEQVHNRSRLEAVQAEQRRLLDELGAGNRRLNEMNKELLDTNEELQAANEEMMLTQEELQATNEEFEATNEELQATNEELETNNEELQATNEELETTNEELLARTNELQELAREVTGERARLFEMVELAPFYIIVLRGPDLRVTAFNPQSERLFAVRDAVGRTLDEVVSPGRGDGLPAVARNVFRTNTVEVTGRMPLRLPDEPADAAEHTFVYTLAPTHDPEGRVDGVVVYAEDVSARAAREAIEQQERLALIIDHAEQVALALYDGATSRRIHASPAYLELVRVARPASDGDVWPEMDILGSREETAGLFRAVMAAGMARRLPAVCVPGPSEPEDRYFDFNLIPIKVEAGETQQAAAYMLISAVDITDLARAHGELARLDQLKDQFLTHASHELRAPIVPLRGYTDLIRRTLQRRESDPAWEARLEHYVNRFDAQIGYLTRMVDDLFDAARLEHGKFSLNCAETDLKALLEHAAEQTRMTGERPPIVLSLPDAPVVAGVDEQRLMQVVLNLLNNAVRYAAESDHVDVRLRREDGPEGDPGFAVVEVQDYGAGIDEAAQQEIFTRFYQAGRDERGSTGLGLGLYIAREIVTQHGGEIGVQSAPGEGSVFTICLPLAAE